MQAHRCNVDCSEGYNVIADWTYVKLYKDDVHHQFIKDFFQKNEDSFAKVNDCIIEKSLFYFYDYLNKIKKIDFHLFLFL